MTQKTKNVALEKFLEENTLKPCDFWAGEALETQMRDCLNITLAQLLLKKIEKKSQMAISKKLSFSKPPILNIFSTKFQGVRCKL